LQVGEYRAGTLRGILSGPFGREYEGVAERVDDPADPRLSEYVDLRDPDLRRRVEPDGGFFVAESPHVIRTVIGAGRRVRSVLVTPVQHDALASALATIDAPVYVAEAEVLRRVVGFDLHRGAVASVDRWPLPSVPGLCAPARRVAVLERVNDHENLGALFRNAAAFGLDAVVLDAECSDPLYRRTVRVSIGHVCTVPWARYASLDEVRGAGLALVALTPDPDAAAIDDIEWPDRCAVMLGAEGPGLSDAALARADLAVRIPMRSDVDSLNVATAAAIAFHISR
jgi:tRNA G18 (ribose-2'-O)-methylase SpoU